MDLTELLPLTRPLVIFDTETTGPEPRDDRIVEIGFIQIKPKDGHNEVHEWQSFVNPLMPIPSEATQGNPDKGFLGHGITDEMVKDAPSFAQLAPHLLRGFKDCDYAGYNVKRFDLPLIRAEFKRAGHEWSYDEARVLDGFRLWQIGRQRTLSDAVEEFLRHKHEGAHRALDDVRASLDVITAQLRAFDTLPRDLAKLHELQWPRDPNAIDPEGKIIWRDGVAVMNFGKNWKGKRLDLMSRRDLDWIANVATGLNKDVKKICQDAINGKFPTREAQ